MKLVLYSSEGIMVQHLWALNQRNDGEVVQDLPPPPSLSASPGLFSISVWGRGSLLLAEELCPWQLWAHPPSSAPRTETQPRSLSSWRSWSPAEQHPCPVPGTQAALLSLWHFALTPNNFALLHRPQQPWTGQRHQSPSGPARRCLGTSLS